MLGVIESHFKNTYHVKDISLDFENDMLEFFKDEKEYSSNTKRKMPKIYNFTNTHISFLTFLVPLANTNQRCYQNYI